jgi:hypothetical protein
MQMDQVPSSHTSRYAVQAKTAACGMVASRVTPGPTHRRRDMSSQIYATMLCRRGHRYPPDTTRCLASFTLPPLPFPFGGGCRNRIIPTIRPTILIVTTSWKGRPIVPNSANTFGFLPTFGDS